MFKLSMTLLSVLASLSGPAALADPVEWLTSNTQTFLTPSDCAADDTCDLKNFVLKMDTYRVHLPDGTLPYGTRMTAKYETGQISSLESYGLVQFLRGCQYSNYYSGGQEKKVGDIDIDHYGSILPFHFTDWVIDGFVRDPMDWGDQPGISSRHYFYRWNTVPGSFDQATAKWFGQESPKNAILYVVDHPGTATYFPDTDSSSNISMLFRTCIFKAADVPRDVADSDVNFARPIHCLDWNSSFIYNRKLGKMESPDGIDPFCR